MSTKAEVHITLPSFSLLEFLKLFNSFPPKKSVSGTSAGFRVPAEERLMVTVDLRKLYESALTRDCKVYFDDTVARS